MGESIEFFEDKEVPSLTGWYIVYRDEGVEENYDAIGPYDSREQAVEVMQGPPELVIIQPNTRKLTRQEIKARVTYEDMVKILGGTPELVVGFDFLDHVPCVAFAAKDREERGLEPNAKATAEWSILLKGGDDILLGPVAVIKSAKWEKFLPVELLGLIIEKDKESNANKDLGGKVEGRD